MSFAYMGKDFYLVTSPKGGALSKSGWRGNGRGEKSSGTASARGKLQNLLYPSCPKSCSSSRAVCTLPCREVAASSTLQVLGETQLPLAARNSHLCLQSPSKRYLSHLLSIKMN